MTMNRTIIGFRVALQLAEIPIEILYKKSNNVQKVVHSVEIVLARLGRVDGGR